jgi:hypothetical protein
MLKAVSVVYTRLRGASVLAYRQGEKLQKFILIEAFWKNAPEKVIAL